MMKKSPPDQHEFTRAPGERRGRLPMPARIGMASFVFSVLMCIPLSGLVAIVMGFWALPRLRGQVQLVGFARAARWGILLGTVNTILQCAGLSQFQQWYSGEIQTAMETRTREAFAAIERGDAAALRSYWSYPESSQPSDEEVRTFNEMLHARYGAFQHLSISYSEFLDQGSGGLFGPPNAVASILLTFERGEVFGEARYQLVISQSTLTPVPHLSLLRLDDPDHPPLMLGAAEEDGTARGDENVPSDEPPTEPDGGSQGP